MRTYGKASVTALLAAVVMIAAVGTASANRLSISNSSFRATFPAFRMEWSLNQVCTLTLEGTFHSRTIVKSPDSLIGYVTRVAGGCPNTTVLLNIPWHIRYRSFTGTLPNIASIRIEIINFSVLIQAMGVVDCLYASTPASPAVATLNVAAGVITSIRMEELARVPLFRRLSGLINCTETIRFSGTGTFELLGTTTAIRVTLI